jgi:hypothetical protein
MVKRSFAGGTGFPILRSCTPLLELNGESLAVADRIGLAREKHLRDGRLDLVKSELER